MAWLAKLDARVARTPAPVRWGYFGVKWTLVVIGAIGLVGWYVNTAGTLGALWYLGFPIIVGLYRGVMGLAPLDE